MRNALGFLWRVYAYLFHLALTLFLLGLGVVAASSGHALQLAMLPWTGSQLNQAVLVLAVAGLLSTLLAMFGLLRWLFPLWALAALALLFRGFFLSSFTYSGPDQFRAAIWLTVGAFAAFLGSLGVFRRRRRY